MCLYWIKKQKLSDPDMGAYLSFGIGAWDPRAGAQPVVFIPDVSPDGLAAAKLALRCTLGRLDPCQLMDVVEDSLC